MIALAPALLLAAAAAPAADAPSEETLLRCTVWSAGQVAQAENDEARRTYSMLLAWFIGRYEGQSRHLITQALGPREIERYSAQGGELNNLCMPIAIRFSARLEGLARKAAD